MNKNIVCPHCFQPDRSAVVINYLTTIRCRGQHITFTAGTLPCRCGAILHINKGEILFTVPPKSDNDKLGGKA